MSARTAAEVRTERFDVRSPDGTPIAVLADGNGPPLVRCHHSSHGHDLCKWPLSHPPLFHWSLHSLLDEGGV
jgi:hypothetical protein